MELYKKYRPKTFKTVVGNRETVRSLQNMIEKNALPHTILFHGPSGCGKTTMAKILKRELKCKDIDFQEINSSTFRGIDSMRKIQQTMNLSSVGPCRVYLMDECHKWTNDAQNAALKMLEDTPSHVYFFLCTTDPQKLIKAVRTRCCEMPVKDLSEDDCLKLLARISKREDLSITDEVKEELTRSCQGSARTLLVMLDKVINLEEEDQLEAIQQVLTEQKEGIDLCRALLKKEKWPKIASILKQLTADPETIRYNVLGYAQAVLLNKGDYQAYLVLDCFKNNFYDSKKPGLVRACYECIVGE